MARYSFFAFIFLLPFAALIFPFKKKLFLSDACYLHTIQVREDPEKTVITKGDWWLSFSNEVNHGFYHGVITSYDNNNIKLSQISIDRALTWSAMYDNGFVTATTLTASGITGEEHDDAFIKKYVSPQLISGSKSVSIMFQTKNGRFLSGLNNRPRLTCNNQSNMPD